MKKYIDTEWLENNAKEYSLGYYEENEWATPLNVLDSAPTIDIVRCKECRFSVNVITSWSANGENKRVERLCKVNSHNVNDNDFCSYGERSSE